MPLSKAHLEALERDLRRHEEALKALRDEQDQMAQVVAIHETILALGRNVALLDLLGEIADSAEVAREASKNFQAYAQGRGIRLPPGIEVSVEIGATHVAVRATSRDSIPPFQVLWESDTGFRSRNLQEDARKARDGKNSKWTDRLVGVASTGSAERAAEAAHQAQ